MAPKGYRFGPDPDPHPDRSSPILAGTLPRVNQPAPIARASDGLRPGQLAPGWRTTFIAGWVGVIAALGAIWQACRVGGIAPWWLGPETNPRFLLVVALPFIPPIIAIIAASTGMGYACHIGIVAGVLVAAVALGDLDHPGLALVEACVGLAGMLISVACLGGRMGPAVETTAVAAEGPVSAAPVEQPLDGVTPQVERGPAPSR